MRKLILAAAAVLALSSSAFALDANWDKVVVKLFWYHNDCAPLPDKLHSMVVTMLNFMDESERTRAMWEFSQVVAGHKDEFCKAMEPVVEQLK